MNMKLLVVVTSPFIYHILYLKKRLDIILYPSNIRTPTANITRIKCHWF